MSGFYPDIALAIPDLLLPQEKFIGDWPVIACDQHTSAPEYWKQVKNLVGDDKPSALNLIFPEVYLGKKNDEQAVKEIKTSMKKYKKQGVWRESSPGFVLVERSTPYITSRLGLVVALDLEEYSYKPLPPGQKKKLIRATECTIESRLPPRMAIRREAELELSHVIVLIDDPFRTVIEPLKASNSLEKLYDFSLPLESGHIKGWKVGNGTFGLIDGVAEALRKLKGSQEEPMLYAMGDGNHSFATAKAIWEELKLKEGICLSDDSERFLKHPARYATVELQNIHDHGIEFQPIHRLVEGTQNQSADLLLDSYIEFCRQEKGIEVEVCYEEGITKQGLSTLVSSAGPAEDSESTVTTESQSSSEDGVENRNSNQKTRLRQAEKDVDTLSRQGSNKTHFHYFVSNSKQGMLKLKNCTEILGVSVLQSWINKLASEERTSSLFKEVDYVHGTEIIADKILNGGDFCGFLLPGMEKSDLFVGVKQDGVLPRKTFSMGHAVDKRFYLEARKIVN